MAKSLELLETTAAEWGLRLSEAQLGQFARYAEELRAWNERVNLTSVTEPEEIERRHFLDSLACAFAWEGDPPASLVDIGTGAGFPGIPLKILWPELRLTLLESIGKKTTFLTHLVAELGMRDVEVVTGRAEELGQDRRHREGYDIAVARAVASLSVLAEYCLPLVRVGGLFLAPKGQALEDELHAARRAISTLGGEPREAFDVDIPGLDRRSLAVVEKLRPTPAAYPRRTGIPARSPL